MDAKETGSRLAPPTSAPSIWSSAIKTADVVGLDAAAVQDAAGLRCICAKLTMDVATDEGVRRGSDRGRSYAAGSDGPNRLVSDDYAAKLLRSQVSHAAAQLASEYLVGLVAFVLVQLLAQAEDGL